MTSSNRSMYKFIWASVLFCIAGLRVNGQNNTQLFYIGKVKLTSEDSLMLSKCKKREFTNTSVEVYLKDANGKMDTIYTSATDQQWWKDSVAFSYTIPGNAHKNSAEIVIHPIYHVECSGLSGNRGVEEYQAQGQDNTVVNINLKCISNPAGATVYLIPKIIWERNPALSKRKEEPALGRYLLYSGTTPVNAIAQEYVYIALFKYKRKFLSIECSPTHFKKDDTVYANFLQE